VKGQEPHPPNSNLALSVDQLNRRMSAMESWRDDLTDKLDRDKGELIEAGEERARRIYRHIDEVRKEVSDKVDDMPDRIIDQLAKLKLLRQPRSEQ
jgi:hypothetical protein